MKKEKFNEILKELDIPFKKWLSLNDIEAFIFSNGKGIFPNWKHIRFLFEKNGNIYIRYGESVPYGAQLPANFFLKSGADYIEFPGRLNIEGNEYYRTFRKPRLGDVIRITDGSKLIAETFVSGLDEFSNMFLIKMTKRIFLTDSRCRLSFYDPKEFSPENCMHSNPIEGIYMKFFPNSGKQNRKYGTFHELVKAKDLKEIILKLNSTKTFRVVEDSSNKEKKQ